MKKRDHNIVMISWSEWRDLNSRPLDPQSSALPAAPHPDDFYIITCSDIKCKSFFEFGRFFYNSFRIRTIIYICSFAYIYILW